MRRKFFLGGVKKTFLFKEDQNHAGRDHRFPYRTGRISGLWDNLKRMKLWSATHLTTPLIRGRSESMSIRTASSATVSGSICPPVGRFPVRSGISPKRGAGHGIKRVPAVGSHSETILGVVRIFPIQRRLADRSSIAATAQKPARTATPVPRSPASFH